MEKDISLKTEPYWSRYPTSVFIDLQICSLLALFAGILFLLHRSLTIGLACVCGFIFVCVYLYYSAQTARRTQRIDGKVISDRTLHIRVGRGFAPQVRSMFFQPVIIFPSEDEIDLNWLAHEVGHIRSRDHFLYIFVKPLLVVFFAAYIGMLLYVVLATDWQWHLIGTDIPIEVFYMIIYLLSSWMLVAFVAFAILSFVPREREYLADRFAHDVMGAEFKEALRKSAKWEGCLVDRSSLTKSFNFFTHPSAAQRLERLRTRSLPLLEASFVSGVLYSCSWVFLNYMHQLAARDFDVQTVSIFSFNHEAYGTVLFYNLAEILVLTTALVYASSVIAFTIKTQRLARAVWHVMTFALGAALFRVIGAFPRFDVLSPKFWQMWVDHFLELWLTDVLLVIFFFCLWWLNKAVKDRVDGFSFYTNAMAAILAVIVIINVTGSS